MRKKVSFCLLFLSYFFFQSVAQSQIKWGPSQVVPKKTFISRVLGEYEGKVYVLREKANSLFTDTEFYVEEFSPDLQLSNSSLFLVPKIKNLTGVIEDIFLLNGKLLAFVSYFDKETGKNSAYAFERPLNSVANSELKQIDEILAPKRNNKGGFSFIMSTDGSKILAYHHSPFEKGGNEKIKYKMLDLSANEVWTKTVELPYRDREFNISDFIVDDKENIFMLSKITNEKEKWSKGKPNYRYNILAVFRVDSTIKEFDVAIPDKSISDIGFRLTPKGELIAAGFYSNIARSEEEIAGTFFLRIDPVSKEVVAKGLKDFDKSFLTEFMSERKANRGNELYSYVIGHIVSDSLGGATVIAEQYYERTICSTDPRSGIVRCNNYYYHNDLIVIKVASGGEIVWTRKVPKKQVSVNDNGIYSSYALAVEGGTINLFFNDNPRNLAIRDNNQTPRYMNNVRRSIITIATINSKGEINRLPAFDSKDHSVALQPHRSVRLNKNTVLVYGRRGKIYKLGKIVSKV